VSVVSTGGAGLSQRGREEAGLKWARVWPVPMEDVGDFRIFDDFSVGKKSKVVSFQKITNIVVTLSLF
jgi:hypothetical protein